MIRFFLLFAISQILNFQTLFAQKPVLFEFENSNQIISNSFYNQIQMVDMRTDTSSLGMFTTSIKLKTNTPISENVPLLMANMIDSTAHKGKLLMVLRTFTFDFQTLKFFLSAEMFSLKNGICYKLSDIDSIALAQRLFYSPNKFIKLGSKIFTDFIANNLLIQADSVNGIKENEILNENEIEKSKMKLYTDTTYVNGLYNTYESFCQQIPDILYTSDKDEKGNATIMVLNENNKRVKANPKDYYGMVYEGKPYVVSVKKYLPLEKRDHDFYFKGKVNTHIKDPSIRIGFQYGAVGVALTSLMDTNIYADFEVKINHKDGSFILLDKIKDIYRKGF